MPRKCEDDLQVPLKTRCVDGMMYIKSVEAQNPISEAWCGGLEDSDPQPTVHGPLSVHGSNGARPPKEH
ncbi:hypothetical protein TNCV_4562261 [Trichonephila clavipes]|nr:hypothetical protein TNCV_4562261 [Trichonephila clavipes]